MMYRVVSPLPILPLLQGSPPASECPFDQAAVYVKARKGAIGAEEAVATRRGRAAHDQKLAAAIAGAWLELPVDIRLRGWPNWSDSCSEGSFDEGGIVVLD